MYQPGMNRQLAQVYYNAVLQAAAAERAQRQATAVWVRPAARQQPLLLAAAASCAVWLLWAFIAH
jgi:hypothetical protein